MHFYFSMIFYNVITNEICLFLLSSRMEGNVNQWYSMTMILYDNVPAYINDMI